MRTAPSDYPVQFSVDYPDRDLSRVTTAFRLFTVIPIAIVLGTVSGAVWTYQYDPAKDVVVATSVGAGGLLVFGPLLMILFRQKYPRWWFDWNLNLMRFSNRVGAYLALMEDRYPSTDEEQYVHLDIAHPDVRHDLNRWLSLVKVVLGHPRLRRVDLLVDRCGGRHHHRLVRHSVHGSISSRAVRLRRGCDPVGEPRDRLRLPPGHRSLPPVPTASIDGSVVTAVPPREPIRRRGHAPALA